MWPWVVAVVVVILVALAFMVPLPRYLESPGSTRDTIDLVTVRGRESWDSDGEIRYLTVSQRRATLAGLIRAWFDSNMDVVTLDEISPTGDRRRDKLIEQAQMDRSKLTALIVAFDLLGLPLTVEGHGALIQGVEEDVPAARILAPGDVIVAVDGRPTTTTTEVRERLDGRKPGDVVTVTVQRNDERRDLDVELAESPDEAGRAMLGVLIQTFDETVDTGFDIELDSGKVIGPSAGLAWTLGVIDRLTPGDITGGRRIAVTGTVDVDGNVGAIGGIDKKVVAAIRDGATLFLYPTETSPEDVERMREAAEGRIEMHAVATVREALEVLGATDLLTPTA